MEVVYLHKVDEKTYPKHIRPIIVISIYIIRGEEVHTFKQKDGILKQLEDGITYTTIIIIAIDLTRVDLEVLVFKIILIMLNNINQM